MASIPNGPWMRIASFGTLKDVLTIRQLYKNSTIGTLWEILTLANGGRFTMISLPDQNFGYHHSTIDEIEKGVIEKLPFLMSCARGLNTSMLAIWFRDSVKRHMVEIAAALFVMAGGEIIRTPVSGVSYCYFNIWQNPDVPSHVCIPVNRKCQHVETIAFDITTGSAKLKFDLLDIIEQQADDIWDSWYD